jgi:hypothetical protein
VEGLWQLSFCTFLHCRAYAIEEVTSVHMGVTCINHYNINTQILGTVLDDSTQSNLQICAAQIQVTAFNKCLWRKPLVQAVVVAAFES